MNDKFLLQISKNIELEWAITSMEIVLNDAKIKNPKQDFSEQEKKIKIFKEFREMFLELIEENRVVRKMFDDLNYNYVLTSEINKKIQLELEQLKKNINF